MSYICGMKVYAITNLGAASNGAGDLFTIAVNTLEVNGSDSYALYAKVVANSQRILTTEIAGDNLGVIEVTPEFYPYATKGAECAAFVTDLSWADNNLNSYEYVKTDNGATLQGWLVFGVLNSTKTEFNDPFGSSLVQNATCWNAAVVTNFRG